MKHNKIIEDEWVSEVAVVVTKAGLLLRHEIMPTSDAYNPSTTIDLAIHRYLAEALPVVAAFPVISEEDYSPFGGLKEGYAWIIDPLDGTLNALTKTNPYCISVALVDLQTTTPILSCVFLPFANRLFTAMRNKGAFLNGKPLKRAPALKKIMAYGLPDNTLQNVDRHLSYLKAVIEEGYITRQTGSTVNDVVMTALGSYHGFYQFGLYLWDFIGADLIAAECGCASYYRKAEQGPGSLRYNYLVAPSAGELETLKNILGY